MTTAQLLERPRPRVQRLMTAEEFAELPDEGPCELVRGKVVPLSNPGGEHGLLEFEIGFQIGLHVKQKRLGKVSCGDAGIILERDPDTVRGPDVAFIRAGRLPSRGRVKGYFKVPPDLCVEVVSPTDRWSEITEKVEMFLAAGVILVWVLDPRTHTARVYRKGREVRVVHLDGSLNGEDVLPGFRLSLAELFAAAE
ncbi:MAG: Uma2 family endonuclease [Planctomycetota bacterium]